MLASLWVILPLKVSSLEYFPIIFPQLFLSNNFFSTVMGYSLVKEFITKDYQASVQAVLDKALDGVETANFEFPLITKAGGKLLKV